MKKTAIIIAAALMLQSITVFAAPFSDVEDAYWAADVIEQMKTEKILDGYEDGSFRPENSLTRAECAKILSCIAKLPEGNASYKDVAKDAWYYDYVSAGGKYFDAGENFEPDKKITREEFATATAKVLGLSESEKALEFSDAGKITNKGMVAAAVESGFISGFDDNTFRPNDPLTRAQCCSMLARAFKPADDDSKPDDVKSEWKITKLSNTKFENFSHNVIADEKGKIILIEKDENEILFEINLPEGETQKETMLELRKFLLRKAEQNNQTGYTDFTPLQLIYDEYTSKTLLFGKFGKYTDENGNTTDVEKYVTLDFTIRIEKYTEFDDSMIKDEKAKDEPALLAMFKDKYAVVSDGYHTIYRFKNDDGSRQGEMFDGKDDAIITSFADGDFLYFITDSMKLEKYDMYNRSFEGETKNLDADLCGMRGGKFWLWNREKGEISTMTPSGKTETVYKNVTIPEDCGINTDRLDKYMLVINDGKFLLYDGTSLYIMEKI